MREIERFVLLLRYKNQLKVLSYLQQQLHIKPDDNDHMRNKKSE